MLSADIEALSLRVARVELELRLLRALIRISTAEQVLAVLRIQKEEAIGIYRDREAAPAGSAPAGSAP